MRSFTILLSLALILCIQVSAQDPLAGTWTNPIIRTHTDSICCIPDSIVIEKSESGYTASYSFPKIWPNPNIQCLFLFSPSGRQDLIVTQKLNGAEYGASLELIENTFVEAFRYKVGNNSSLDIKNSPINGNAVGGVCDFSLIDFEPAVPDTPVGKWINPIVHVQTDFACCVPDSIVITGSGPTYNATYSYSTNSSNPNVQCSALFAAASGRKDLVVTKKLDGNEYGASLVLQDTVVIEGFYYSLNSNGYQLNIYNSLVNGNAVGTVCNFTMNYTSPIPPVEPPVEVPRLALGTWTNATIRVQTDVACCIPTSIKIEESGLGYRATYTWAPGPLGISMNLQCTRLFSVQSLISQGFMNVTNMAGDNYYGASLIFANNTFIETFRYNVSNASKLDILNSPKNGTATGAVCSFTFNNFQPTL